MSSSSRSNYSLRAIFGFVVGIPVLFLFGVLIVHGYYLSRHEAAKALREQMVTEVQSRAKTLNHQLALMARSPAQIAEAISIRKPRDVDEILSFQYSMLADNPVIYGNAVAWEPYMFDPNKKHFSPYTWRNLNEGGAIGHMMFTPENDYDYFAGWDWYDEPRKKYRDVPQTSSPLSFTPEPEEREKLPRIEQGLWSPPYFDEGGGNVLMCTYSAPFFVDRRFAGVVTCDVTTDWIADFLATESFEDGFFALFANDGAIISHPNLELILERLDDVAARRGEAWHEVAAEMRRFSADYIYESPAGKPGHDILYLPSLSMELPGITQSGLVWIEGTQLQSTGWILLYSVPRKNAYKNANAQFHSRLLIFLLGLGLLGVYLFWFVDQRVVRPIQRLNLATRAIAEGDFDYETDSRAVTGKELDELFRNFNTMARTLRHSIEQAVHSASAKETAEAASQAKSEFLMLVSHELRTPLSGAMGVTELLAQTSLATVQRDYLDLLRESENALLLLINNILDYSKLELDGITIENRRFDLRDMVDSVVTMLRYQARARNLTIDTRFDGEIEFQVFGAESRIRQVLSNLLGNALKFSKDGTIRLNISRDETQGTTVQYVLFEVVDHGIGISRERQDGLFSMTWKSDVSSKRIYDGMGLGLAISKSIIDSLEGKIGVHSVKDQGSTFWFSIPLPAATVPAVTVPAVTVSSSSPALIPKAGDDTSTLEDEITTATSHENSGPGLDEGMNKEMHSATSASDKDADTGFPTHETTATSGETESTDSAKALSPRPARVLVAEDNRINQIVIKEILANAGYECTLVDNGDKAVRAWQEHDFDLILMDCQMPEVDGYEATKIIRDREKTSAGTPPIPIVALTANAAPGDKEYCLDIGMNSYCNKPIKPQELIDTIERWVGALTDNPTR